MDFDYVRDETTRNLPDDVDFERDHLRVVTEFAEGGENLLNANISSTGSILCAFNGTTSRCLLESYVGKNSKDVHLIARSFVVKGEDNGTELGLEEVVSLKREVLSLYRQGDLLLMTIDQDQYGSSVIDQLLESAILKSVLGDAKSVFIFHTEPNSKFRSNGPSDSLYYVRTAVFQMDELQATKLVKPLPMPNLIENFSAAVLTYCESVGKPCVLLVNYTEFGDSGSHIPFVKLISSVPSLNTLLRIPLDFTLKTKVNNAILYNSNLFI